jgi:hypothetical protein
MKPEEKIARIIARALGHNDDTGMHWERYVLAARLLLKEARVTFTESTMSPATDRG